MLFSLRKHLLKNSLPSHAPTSAVSMCHLTLPKFHLLSHHFFLALFDKLSLGIITRPVPACYIAKSAPTWMIWFSGAAEYCGKTRGLAGALNGLEIRPLSFVLLLSAFSVFPPPSGHWQKQTASQQYTALVFYLLKCSNAAVVCCFLSWYNIMLCDSLSNTGLLRMLHMMENIRMTCRW